MLKKGRLMGTELPSHQGLVEVFEDQGQRGIVLTAGSPDALLRMGRAFFLRWPYFWEVWGREEGATYFRLEFGRGGIQALFVQALFPSEEERTKAARVLGALQHSQRRGQQTGVLTYPGCTEIKFQLLSAKETTTVILPRVGYPKRILTPSYKPVSRTKITGKDFDLTSLFTTRGLYADGDKDGIPDGVDTVIITPHDLDTPSLTRLATRFILPTVGASFPLVWLDSEIEEPKSLKAPILVGRSNQFYQDLLKTGKTQEPSLEASWGRIQVIPEGFDPSHVLAVIGRDKEGLDRTLAYMAQTFPHLKEFGEGNPSVDDIATCEFIWEGDEALELIRLKMDELEGSDLPVRVHPGLSESPSVRRMLKERIKTLYTHILKKTGNRPTFAEQPYFKRLLVEMHFSEPATASAWTRR